MMIRYRSDYPNQVQQLNVSLSKHYHLLKDGTIKWQEKTMDINWKNYQKTGKRHLVNYVIRDHYSSCFYAEMHPVDTMPDIEEFLYRAWSNKEDYEFHGIGKTVMVPQVTLKQFPQLHTFFKLAEDITSLQVPESGFSSGIVAIKEWESNLRFAIDMIEGIENIQGFQKDIAYINRFINFRFEREGTPLDRWLKGYDGTIGTNRKEVFFKYFQQQKNSGTA
ncbi:MAG TPA: hypothetical protein VN040_17795 [Pseudosphingobacterium sp.]|nr:hypothetical protein [Pseudosphingobacterium sp.]